MSCRFNQNTVFSYNAVLPHQSASDSRKRGRGLSPPSLLPATKTARVEQKQVSMSPDCPSTKDMDEEIFQHFLGMLIQFLIKSRMHYHILSACFEAGKAIMLYPTRHTYKIPIMCSLN